MMRASFAILLLLVTTCIASGAAVADKLPKDSSEGFSAYVQQSLLVPTTGDDVVRPLLEYMDRFGNSSTRKATESSLKDDATLTDLADKMLRGLTPDLLTKRYVDKVHVSSWQNYEPKAVGSHYLPMHALFKALSQGAQRKRETDAITSDRWARAALVLAFQDRVQLGLFCCGFDRALADCILSPPADADAVVALRDALEAERVACLRDLKITTTTLLELIETPDDTQKWETLTPKFLEAWELGWAKCPRVTIIRFHFASDAWRLMCLAKSCKQASVLQPQLEKVVERLKAQTPDPLCARWLDEILSLPGPVPKQPSVRIFETPNDIKIGYPN